MFGCFIPLTPLTVVDLLILHLDIAFGMILKNVCA